MTNPAMTTATSITTRLSNSRSSTNQRSSCAGIRRTRGSSISNGFARLADSIGATLVADIAHIAGLCAGGAHPSPFPHAHIATTTTHKTLRGPRGGLVMTNDEELAKIIDRAIFPGTQGGPLMHIISAKAVAFGEALQPEFKTYAKQVVTNARTLAEELMNRGHHLVSNGTDNHLMLMDLRKFDSEIDRQGRSAGGWSRRASLPIRTQ